MPQARQIFLLGLALFFGVSSVLYTQNTNNSVIDGITFNQEELSLVLDIEPTSEIEPRRSYAGGIGAIIQAIISLLFVIGLIFITLHLLRKGSGNAPVASSAVSILVQQTLKAGASLLVVNVAGKVLILGVGDDVNLISEVTDQEIIDQLKLTAPVPAATSFVSLLSQRLTQKGHQPNIRVTQPKEFLRKYTDRLVKPSTPDEDSSL
jgi:flagellar biogenesis protein FliO